VSGPAPPVDDPSGTGEMTSETLHKVYAPVLNAAHRDCRGRRYQPSSIKVTWKRSTAGGPSPWWCGWITLYGLQIRMDGSQGIREINETIWVRNGQPELSVLGDQQPCPAWAWDFYERSMPTWGRPTL
jgi:hypothetical protein